MTHLTVVGTASDQLMPATATMTIGADRNEKPATMEIQKPKPACSTQQRHAKGCAQICVPVLEVRDARAGGSCCMCSRFVPLALEVCAACAGDCAQCG